MKASTRIENSARIENWIKAPLLKAGITDRRGSISIIVYLLGQLCTHLRLFSACVL